MKDLLEKCQNRLINLFFDRIRWTPNFQWIKMQWTVVCISLKICFNQIYISDGPSNDFKNDNLQWMNTWFYLLSSEMTQSASQIIWNRNTFFNRWTWTRHALRKSSIRLLYQCCKRYNWIDNNFCRIVLYRRNSVTFHTFFSPLILSDYHVDRITAFNVHSTNKLSYLPLYFSERKKNRILFKSSAKKIVFISR